jgi:hypothetical protein
MKPPVGTTFVVAACLLGLAAVAQLIAVLVYFGPGLKETAVAPAVAAEAPAAPEPAVAVPAEEPPVAEETAEQSARMAELLAEAARLEAGASPGDALVPLEEALTLRPRDPEVLSKLAALHERLGQTELAETAWKSLVELGPEAGPFLQVAEIRLRLLQPGGDPASLALRDQVGLQPGSSLGVVDLTVKENEAGGVATKDLRLAVKARPGDPIDSRDVRIDVSFYETIDGEIVPTASRVQSLWFTTPVDWKNEGIEILEVKYEVPRMGADGGPPPRYYGYMVNIYHRGQLQETRADPVDLQELFPAALTELAPVEGAEAEAAAP